MRASRVADSLMTLFVVGSLAPWRLIEVLHTPHGRSRKMLCFDSEAQLQSAIDERLAWQRADTEFVERNMSTTGGPVTSDWVHSKDFDLLFGAVREEIRRTICVTAPVRSVTFGLLGR